jgi:hypothetical protein
VYVEEGGKEIEGRTLDAEGCYALVDGVECIFCGVLESMTSKQPFLSASAPALVMGN